MWFVNIVVVVGKAKGVVTIIQVSQGRIRQKKAICTTEKIRTTDWCNTTRGHL
jgi:hypothetical protein